MTEELKACREAFEKFDIGAYPPYDHRMDDNGNYVISGRQRMWEIWQAAWNARPTVTPTDGDAEVKND